MTTTMFAFVDADAPPTPAGAGVLECEAPDAPGTPVPACDAASDAWGDWRPSSEAEDMQERRFLARRILAVRLAALMESGMAKDCREAWAIVTEMRVDGRIYLTANV